MRTWMKLVVAAVLIAPLLLGCGGSSSDPDSQDTSPEEEFFIGEWHVTGEEGDYFITFHEDGSLIMADYYGGPAHLTGSWTVDADTAVGPLDNPRVGTAEFIAMRTGEDTMSYEFIEHWGPGKHIPLNGVKL